MLFKTEFKYEDYVLKSNLNIFKPQNSSYTNMYLITIGQSDYTPTKNSSQSRCSVCSLIQDTGVPRLGIAWLS